VLRFMTVRVDELEEGPSAMMRKVDRDRERDERRDDRRGDDRRGDDRRGDDRRGDRRRDGRGRDDEGIETAEDVA
ncbi:MAG: 30S ribosomal protein S6, partial [Xanthobacteraceae bacterium]